MIGMNKNTFLDIVIVISLIGMIACLCIEVADKSKGYESVERLKFDWWFYMQGGREQTIEELEGISYLCYDFNFTTPYYFTNLTELKNYEFNETEMEDSWRGIARRRYEERKR